MRAHPFSDDDTTEDKGQEKKEMSDQLICGIIHSKICTLGDQAYYDYFFLMILESTQSCQ